MLLESVLHLSPSSTPQGQQELAKPILPLKLQQTGNIFILTSKIASFERQLLFVISAVDLSETLGT